MCQQTLIFKKYWVIAGLKSVDEKNTRWHCINTYKVFLFCFKRGIWYENLIEMCRICSLIFVLWSL